MPILTDYPDLFNSYQHQNTISKKLTPGKSGALVLYVGFLNTIDNKHYHWIVKTVNKEKIPLLMKERVNIENYAKYIYPDTKIELSINGAIATSFIGSDYCFYDHLKLPQDKNIKVIENIFKKMDVWYEILENENTSFFDKYQLYNDVINLIDTNIINLWEKVKNSWHIERGFYKTICHGDLNPTNILIKNDDCNTIELIDFAETGFNHWAFDFIRLEREITFLIIQTLQQQNEKEDIKIKNIKKIFKILDAEYSFKNNINSIENSKINELLILINQIREECKKRFMDKVNKNSFNTKLTYFEEEYFLMLAFQEMCLIVSNVKSIDDKLKNLYYFSINGILNRILHKKYAEPYYYGYFYTINDGFERVLIQQDNNNNWNFPITGFINKSESITQTIHKKIRKFIDNYSIPISNSQFGQIEIINQSLFLFPDYPHIIYENNKVYIEPVFIKIKVNKEFSVNKNPFVENNYSWVKKIPLIKKGKINNLDVVNPNKTLVEYIQNDFIINELEFNILQCVDIIVFREKENHINNNYEFLLLHRAECKSKDTGWEYPKGGLEYHETILEGAIRELLEETGVQSIGDFKFGGYLETQTPDVRRRWKNYDLLRVHGTTFYYAGDPETIHNFIINNTDKDREHDDSKWVSLENAQTWLTEDNYGPIFFKRWEENSYEIFKNISRPISLAFEITERCNHTCKFCHRRIIRDNELNEIEIKKIINMLVYRGIYRLTITGGEPLLLGKERIFKLIEFINSKQIHTCLSTTGIGNEWTISENDIQQLDNKLDHLLLSFHVVNEKYAKKVYYNINDWQNMKNILIKILEWVKKTNINLEICTIVTKKNINNIIEIGKFIFGKNEKIFWRIDEYYSNGEISAQGNGANSVNRRQFEISNGEFNLLQISIENEEFFSKFINEKRIKFNSKDDRKSAPDIMITPSGNIVTSCNNEYVLKGDSSTLLHMDFKNRRTWKDYRRYCRTDWPWENYFI